ncbi:YicC/YloC family endoribonuclease [Neisseria leonii]|uniref:YicC family protein n=1 Tax=Neisseria leonii TaxID=2995413 RepID=A0A9X4E1R7_9NEIS|nr:YicC/YloC family endoribonuclease [Neisseria sp. 51.81]MDD9327554.1 YicC family protein [Neisseria sp. 51.81]
MSLYSMTGFGSAAGVCGSRHIQIDIRSVNHRFLDIQFKMPDELRHLESSLRDIIVQTAQRGKIECRIQLQNTVQTAGLNVNHELAARLAELNRRWRNEFDGLGKLTVADILKFPGVLTAQENHQDELADTVRTLAAEAADGFAQSRRREGEKLQAHLAERLDAIQEIVEALAELFPHLLQAHLEKIRARLAEAVANIGEDRLQQEFAIYMQKADIDEEFSRLKTHIAEVRRIIGSHKGSAGKRLDFLMQELNREANTLGSKAISAECTQASVELKVLIEQMREQVQNIE